MQAHNISVLLVIIIFVLTNLNKKVLTKKRVLNRKQSNLTHDTQHFKKNHLHLFQNRHPPHDNSEEEIPLRQTLHPLLDSNSSRDGLQTRIVNGHALPDDTSFPYVAALYYCATSEQVNVSGCKKFCEGSIISPLHILTVEHCLILNGAPVYPGNINVRVGVKDLSDPETTGTIFKTVALVVHRQYIHTALLNDIALIKLQQSMTWSTYIQPVYINGLHFSYAFPYLNVITAGWGPFYPSVPNKLKFAKMFIYDKLHCLASLGWAKPLDFCVKIFNEAEGYPCTGEEGAGLLPMIQNKQYVNVLIGMFSTSARYDAKGAMLCASPMLFVNISTYAAWINYNVGL